MDVWIDITYGVFPDTEPLEGAVKIGDNLTLAIYVKDSANNTDIRIKDCYAYDNIKSAKNGIKPAQLQLTEESGCPLRENLMGVWRRTVNTMDTGATMIAFNNLKVKLFEFPKSFLDSLRFSTPPPSLSTFGRPSNFRNETRYFWPVTLICAERTVRSAVRPNRRIRTKSRQWAKTRPAIISSRSRAWEAITRIRTM